jgi:hypothetical protein
MTTTMKQDDAKWLLKMADLEDGSELSVGGLAHELGMFPSSHSPSSVTTPVFSRLVELRRRDLRFTVEELAKRADVEISDVLSIECGASATLSHPFPWSSFETSFYLTAATIHQAKMG